MRKTFSACGKQNGKGTNRPRKGERTNRSKLKGMTMMNKWSWSTYEHKGKGLSISCLLGQLGRLECLTTFQG
jgi:hypothetical protein